MAEKDQGEKTEEATPQRREDFRKRGQVAQTRELASVLALFSIMLLMWLLGRFFLAQLHEVFNRSLGTYLVQAARQEDWIVAARFALTQTFLLVAPIFGFLWLMALASGLVQVGFLHNEEALKFKPERLNPVQGLKRIFSLRSLVEGLKAIFKVVIVSGIVYLIIRAEFLTVPHLSNYSMEQIFLYLGEMILKLLGGVGFFMAALAGVDYLFQRWEMEKQMRMSKQELKEELKSREGDPMVKARIRRIQKELSNKRMMADVPKADVIVTNPTHIAVAIKYDGTMVAPRILAKGAGVVAAKIRELAKSHNIPIVENKPLARTIYKTLKVGQTIPRELYAAVAEVLSYVYKLQGRRVN